MEKLSLKQFADKMGLRPPQVTLGIQQGKITPYIDENGRKYLYFDEAKEQWERNLDKEMSDKAKMRYTK